MVTGITVTTHRVAGIRLAKIQLLWRLDLTERSADFF
jgi:hypothetical protein